MAATAIPSVRQVPQPPVRKDAPANFASKADTFVASFPGLVSDINLAVDGMNLLGTYLDTLTATNQGYKNAAAKSVDDAAAQVKIATDQAVASKASADAAAGSLASVKVVAQAVDAAAGLPPSNLPGGVLRQKLDGSDQKEWWLPVLSQVGDTIVSTQAPSPDWVPTGRSFQQSSAPALFAKLGAIADWPSDQVTYGPAMGPIGGNNYNFTSPAYGNGVYVTLATSGGFVVRSNDAFASFTSYNILNTNWYDVDFGSGKFVAVAGAGYFYYSADGITWGGGQYATGAWRVRAGAANFVAASLGTSTATAIMTSTDGVTWTPRAAPAGPQVRPAYGAGLYVLLCTDGCYTSTDGVSWTKRPSFPFVPNGNCSIEYLAGVGFLAINPAAGVCAVSTDGINWVSGAKFPSASGASLFAGQGGFLLIPNSNTAPAYSTADGTKWTQRNLYFTAGSLLRSVFVNRTHIFIPNVSNPTAIRVKPFSYDPTTQFWTTDAQPTAQGLTQYIRAT